MAGDEVRVKVGGEDMADLEAKLLGIGEVLLDIALGIDDDGGRADLISEQIRSVGRAAQVVLLKNHRNLCCLPQSGHATNQCRSRGLGNPNSKVPPGAMPMADTMMFARDERVKASDVKVSRPISLEGAIKPQAAHGIVAAETANLCG